MNKFRSLFTTLAFAAVLTPLVAQQSDEDKSLNIISQAVQSLYLGNNYGSVSLRFMSQPKISFSGFGSLPVSTAFGPPTGNANRSYNDGYVLIDSTGNANGTSGYWYYQYASQVTSNGDIAFHSYSGSAIPGQGNVSSKEGVGLEINYAYEFGRLGGSKVEWGVLVGFGFNGFNSSIRNTVTGNLITITDVYSLNGATPPGAPYSAPSSSVDSSGKVTDTTVPIGAQPISRTISNSPTNFTQRLQVKGAYMAFHLGPVIRVPLGEHFKLSATAGLAAGYFGTTFTSDETTVLPESGTAANVTNQSQRDLMILGGYAEANAEYWLTDRTGFFAGVTYEKLGSYKHSLAGVTAKIDASSATGFRLGIVTRF